MKESYDFFYDENPFFILETDFFFRKTRLTPLTRAYIIKLQRKGNRFLRFSKKRRNTMKKNYEIPLIEVEELVMKDCMVPSSFQEEGSGQSEDFDAFWGNQL